MSQEVSWPAIGPIGPHASNSTELRAAQDAPEAPALDCCVICGAPVNKHDADTWKRVMGFVRGPKSDGLTLRDYTGEYAHDHCIRDQQNGVAPDQGSLFDERD